MVSPQSFDAKELQVELDDTFQAILDAVRNRRNVLITGKAGTGKSTLLTYVVRNELARNLIVLAPTGVAALNVEGMTIHRFFSFPGEVTAEIVEPGDYHPVFIKR